MSGCRERYPVLQPASPRLRLHLLSWLRGIRCPRFLLRSVPPANSHALHAPVEPRLPHFFPALVRFSHPFYGTPLHPHCTQFVHMYSSRCAFLIKGRPGEVRSEREWNAGRARLLRSLPYCRCRRCSRCSRRSSVRAAQVLRAAQVVRCSRQSARAQASPHYLHRVDGTTVGGTTVGVKGTGVIQCAACPHRRRGGGMQAPCLSRGSAHHAVLQPPHRELPSLSPAAVPPLWATSAQRRWAQACSASAIAVKGGRCSKPQPSTRCGGMLWALRCGSCSAVGSAAAAAAASWITAAHVAWVRLATASASIPCAGVRRSPPSAQRTALCAGSGPAGSRQQGGKAGRAAVMASGAACRRDPPPAQHCGGQRYLNSALGLSH